MSRDLLQEGHMEEAFSLNCDYFSKYLRCSTNEFLKSNAEVIRGFPFNDIWCANPPSCMVHREQPKAQGSPI